MNNEYVHICIVLDASGSMRRIESDIKGTFNSFMADQKREEGKTVFDVFKFSNEVKRIVEHANVADYNGELMQSYSCLGWTALHDAVCTAIDTLGRELAAMPEEERPGKVLFAIVTDGRENCSTQFTLADVKTRIDRQTNEYNWEFVYLAANQDEFEARDISRSMGVSQSLTAARMEDLSSMTCQSLRMSLTEARMRAMQKKKNRK